MANTIWGYANTALYTLHPTHHVVAELDRTGEAQPVLGVTGPWVLGLWTLVVLFASDVVEPGAGEGGAGVGLPFAAALAAVEAVVVVFVHGGCLSGEVVAALDEGRRGLGCPAVARVSGGVE